MEIKDYLHFYIGQKLERGGTITHALLDAAEKAAFNAYADFKPILRKLSDMTEEDAMMIYKFGASYAITNPKHSLLGFTRPPFQPIHGLNSCGLMMELLSKGFDLFGLIDAGLAIDSKSL